MGHSLIADVGLNKVTLRDFILLTDSTTRSQSEWVRSDEENQSRVSCHAILSGVEEKRGKAQRPVSSAEWGRSSGVVFENRAANC